MKLKICFLILLVFGIIPTICNAKTIAINNKTYNVETILETDTYVYNALEDTLTLNNANLETIRSDSYLKINLVGENTLSNKGCPAIEAYNLEIIGNGSLTISTDYTAIHGTTLKINDATIKVNSSNFAFSSSNDLYINNSNIIASASYCIFDVSDSNVNIDNSSVIVNNTHYFVDTFTKELFIKNSNVSILECDMYRFMGYNTYISGNSTLNIYAKENKLPNRFYVLEGKISFLGSNDDITYYDISESNDKYLYIKIVTKNPDDYLNELKDFEEQLIKKEQQLKLYEEYLQQMEKTIQEETNKLNIREGELNSLYNELLIIDNSLQEKKENLDELQKNLSIKEQILTNIEQKLLERENALAQKSAENEQQNLIKEEKLLQKEEELNEQFLYQEQEMNNIILNNQQETQKLVLKEQNLLSRQKELENLELKLKQKEEVNLRKIDNDKTNLIVNENREVLKNAILENDSQSTNKCISSLENNTKIFLSAIVSFLSGGVMAILTKKRGFVRG